MKQEDLRIGMRVRFKDEVLTVEGAVSKIDQGLLWIKVNRAVGVGSSALPSGKMFILESSWLSCVERFIPKVRLFD